MDKTPSSRAEFEVRGHHHEAADLPRPWITLPASECRAARSQPLLRGLFPSHVGFFPKAREHRVARPGIESTIVNYCVKGSGWCELLGRRFPVKRGDVMVIPSRTAHAYGSDAEHPWSVYWFHAMGENIPLLMAELRVSRERPVVHLGQSGELVALFSELRETLEDDYSRPTLLYASQVLTYLWGVMIRLQAQASQLGNGTALRVRQTIEHVQRHFAGPMRVETLAAMAGLSASQYTARFRALTGHGPKSYLTRLRIHRAAELLGTSSESIASIARRVGFDDPLYFSRAFRRAHDVCPSAYREGRLRERKAGRAASARAAVT